jgi:preprotein translocase subunit SecA
MENSNQFLSLTSALEEKAKKYKELCSKLDEYEKENIKLDDKRLIELKNEFQKNLTEIQEINNRLKNLK